MNAIKTVGVVGAGTMGAALAQKFAQEGFKVILADRSIDIVEKGVNNIRKTLQDGIEKNVFSIEQVDTFLSNLSSTGNLKDLSACDLVIEAIYENFEAKTDLFKELSKIISADCLLATNTSSFSVTELSASVKDPERFIGLHFFYHAAKNRLVEIIRGEKTSDKTYEKIKIFSALAGKDAITCLDAYGFAVNRFFVPWLNEAVRLNEKGIAKEAIDKECQKIFGIGMGPFALMNATGVPVAYHAEKTLEIFGNLYKVAPGLKLQAESGKPWELKETDHFFVDAETEKIIRKRMLGIVYFVCSQILDETICTATDLNRGAKIGLRWKKGPIDLMKESGVVEVAGLLMNINNLYEMNLPSAIGEYYWNTENVKLEENKDIAVITMDQPENLNALSEVTMRQLENCFDIANNNPLIKTIFITGSGKAFVAGADIRFFIKKIRNSRICDIESFTEYGQRVFDKIDKSSKKIIAILNGLALGGGLELALCADFILATPKAQMAFPETSIGIYPGLGGTQRSVHKIGIGLSKYLIHTGKMINATEANEIGLVDAIIQPGELFEIIKGSAPIPTAKPKILFEKWKAISLFFENNSIEEILHKKYSDDKLPESEKEKIIKSLKFKAPIALKLADRLITEAKGCQSELDHLREIFSTSDALLGLTSIGKKVEYQGK